ncbi:MAG: sulfotransferase family protein [Pseudomonadota bacterium]
MGKPFKVFGIGFHKTGTSSLRQALRLLGYNHHPYRPVLTRALAQGDMAALFDAAEAFDSFEDWPWPLVWRALDDRYGDAARFVLTRRASAEIWLDSLKSHAERSAGGGFARRMAYGHAFPHGQERAHLDTYHAHLDAVRRHFAVPERAHRFTELCWEAGDGWPELCSFLGEAPPESGFPHANAKSAARPDASRIALNLARIRRTVRRRDDTQAVRRR